MKHSMKVVFVVALLLAATQSVNAQSSSSRVPSRFHFGIKGGATANIYMGDNDNTDAFFFPTGGLAMDFQVAKIPLFIGIGANYANFGLKDRKTFDAHSIQVPVTTSYHIGVAPNFFINPFLGGFAAYNFNDDFNKQFNAGVRAGCGFNYGRLTWEVGYDQGLLNLGTKNNDVISGTLFVTVGFNFAGSR